jgi:hypothetical protein
MSRTNLAEYRMQRAKEILVESEKAMQKIIEQDKSD